MRRTAPGSRIGRAGVAIGLLASIAIGGCAKDPLFVLDSDIPAPYGAEGRATSGIERRDGVLVGVDSVFGSKVDDPVGTIDALVPRFTAVGWVVGRRGSTDSTATVVFAKGDRRCRVRVVRNELDPAMSRIAYRLDQVRPDETSSPAEATDG